MITPNYTAAELRTTADAIDAQAAGKPVQQMRPGVRDGEWHMLGICGIVIDGYWRYRPAPAPEVIPWTRETLPPLPVEVVNKSTGDHYTILAVNNGLFYVASIGWLKCRIVFENFTRPDGSPCGEVMA